MPRTKSSTSSASEIKQPTVKELREWYAKNERDLQNYQMAQDSIKKLVNLSKNVATKTISAFTKDTIISYLQNPGQNEKNLRNLSRYLYYRSHVYYRVIEFYANMAMLDARTVIPKYDLTKALNTSKALKSYNQTLDIVDRMNLTKNFKKVYSTVFREDIFYGVYWLDDDGMIIIPIDPDYGRISSTTSYGNYLWAMDMTWFRNRQDILELWGEPFVSLYNKSQQQGESKWQEIPPEHSLCIKFRDDHELIVPPFSGTFLSLINLEDLANIQAIADEQSIYRMVYQKLKPLASAKASDDFEVDVNMAIEYSKVLQDTALPDYTSFAIVPGSDDLGIIDFSENDAATDTNKITKATESVLNIAGGAEVLNGASITSAAAFKASAIANTQFALSSIIPQTEAWVEMVLATQMNDAAKVHFFIVSPYTKEDFQEQLLTGAQNGLPTALAYNTFNELDERDTMSLLELQKMLKIPESLTPLQTSYTQSGSSGEVGQGRDPVPDDELSDSGQRSRDA